MTYWSRSVQTGAKGKVSLCPLSSPCTLVPMVTWGRACYVSKQPAGFHQCRGVVTWTSFSSSTHLSILVSVSPSKKAVWAPRQKKKQQTSKKRKGKRNCGHNLSFLILDHLTFHVRGTNILWYGRWEGGVLYRVAVHHVGTRAMLLFHLIAILCVFQTLLPFFCWSSTKQFEIILVSCRCRCFLKNRLLAGVYVVLSVKAELNVLADFQPIQLRAEVQQQGNIKQTAVHTCFNWLDNPEDWATFFLCYWKLCFTHFTLGRGDNQLWGDDAFDGSFKLRAVFKLDFSYHCAQSLAEETSHVHPVFAGLQKKNKKSILTPNTQRETNPHMVSPSLSS